jgi:hypothetical protein
VAIQGVGSEIVVVLLTDLSVDSSAISHFRAMKRHTHLYKTTVRVVCVEMGVEKVSEIIFSTLVLIISAGVTAHILQGYGSNKWKESFLAIILAMACLTQVWKISQEQLNMTINRCTFLLMLLLMFL